MLHKLKSIRRVLVFMSSSLGQAYMRLFFYRCLVKAIAAIHLVLIVGNVISIGLVIYYTPFYIWLPIATIIISPVMGGSHCFLNRLENYYRIKAMMPQIHDRLQAFFERKK